MIHCKCTRICDANLPTSWRPFVMINRRAGWLYAATDIDSSQYKKNSLNGGSGEKKLYYINISDSEKRKA